jgi:hypothetical protein
MSNLIPANFTSLWHLLTKSHRQIFKILQWYSQRFDYVFISLDTIARDCKVSRSTVKRALNVFRKNEWFGSHRRGYQTSLLFLSDELIDLDTNEIGKRTLNEPVLDTLSKEKINLDGATSSREENLKESVDEEQKQVDEQHDVSNPKAIKGFVEIQKIGIKAKSDDYFTWIKQFGRKNTLLVIQKCQSYLNEINNHAGYIQKALQNKLGCGKIFANKRSL